MNFRMKIVFNNIALSKHKAHKDYLYYKLFFKLHKGVKLIKGHEDFSIKRKL